MKSFSFSTASEIRYGRGIADDAVRDFAATYRTALLVTGSNPDRNARLARVLEDAGCKPVRFAVATEPDVAVIEAGIEAARHCGAQSVVAIGGGSVIDAGKAIAALVPATRPMTDHLEVVGKGLPLDLPPLPFAAVPTTSGTGAEVTRNAVIAVPGARRKVSLRDRMMLPRVAIVDPALTDHCPSHVTLASGLDAVTQVIEPYVCTRANPMTDALCRDAIPVGLAALKTLMEREDPDSRDRMAWISLCGGLALANAGLGVVHGLAGPLGGLSGAAHGAICGALLPHGLAMNSGKASDPDIAARMARIRGWIAETLGGTAEDAFERLADWSRDAGLPGLDAQGIPAEARVAAARAASTSSSMKANPVALTEAELATVMEYAR